MRITRTISRAAVASLLAGGLALTVVSGTALAEPVQTLNGAGVVHSAVVSPAPRPNNNAQFKRGLQDGLRDGNRDGLRQAKKTCRQLNRQHANVQAQSLSSYQQGYNLGYTQGFDNGFNAGVKQFCRRR
jgi:flagellar biosynthesis/type III secretory pathway protein FliH